MGEERNMIGLKEQYPGSREDLKGVSKWYRRKIMDFLFGRKYVFNRQDFLDLAKGIRFGNWMMTKYGHNKLTQKFLDSAFGPVEKPKVHSRVIPISAKVKKSKNAIIPYKLIDDFLDSAGFRIILDDCLCRRGMECKDYPIDFGCIMLGEGAKVMLEQGHGREVTSEEAKKYAREAEKLGLVPFAAHAKFEEQTMGVPKELRHKFIELCFCCPCCCIAMKNLKYYTPDIHKHNFINVGFVAKALPECKGCKKCVSACPAEAINVNGTKVWVNEDKCIGCGVCIHSCEFDAIKLVQVGKPMGDLMDYFGGLELDLT